MKKQDVKILTCTELGEINEDVLRKTIQKMNSEGKRITSVNMDFGAGIICILYDLKEGSA